MGVAKKVEDMKRKAEALADEAAHREGYAPRATSDGGESPDGSELPDAGKQSD